MPFSFKIRTSTKPQNGIFVFQSLVLQPTIPISPRKIPKVGLKPKAPNLRVRGRNFKEARGSQNSVNPWCMKLGFDAWKARGRLGDPWCKISPTTGSMEPRTETKPWRNPSPKPTGFGGKL